MVCSEIQFFVFFRADAASSFVFFNYWPICGFKKKAVRRIRARQRTKSRTEKTVW